MATLMETPFWEPGIYQLETSDPVLGGPDGVDNKQGKELANRTAWLREKVLWLIENPLPTHTHKLADISDAGTAASKNAAKSTSDSTAGTLMLTGGFGIGGSVLGKSGSTDVSMPTGLYYYPGSMEGEAKQSFAIRVTHNLETGTGFEIFNRYYQNRLYFRYTNSAGVWQPACEFYHSGSTIIYSSTVDELPNVYITAEGKLCRATKPPVTDVSWSNIGDRPETFPPASHRHLLSEIDGVGTAASKDVGTSAKAGNVLAAGSFGIFPDKALPYTDNLDTEACGWSNVDASAVSGHEVWGICHTFSSGGVGPAAFEKTRSVHQVFYGADGRLSWRVQLDTNPWTRWYKAGEMESVFLTSTTTLTVPDWAHEAIVEVQGAGGGGSSVPDKNLKSSAGAGGSGAFGKARVPVSPGQQIICTIGKGGAPTPLGSSVIAESGEESSFGSLLRCGGGGGAHGITGGVAAVTVVGANLMYRYGQTGQSGETWDTLLPLTGGQGGGEYGGYGGRYKSDGMPAVQNSGCGGGGAGSCDINSDYNDRLGGKGADGYISVTWIS